MRPHVVIVGGGFGGLNAAKVLGSQDVDVTLIDRENYHLFQPLLYQVATAALSPADIAAPIRHILRRHPNVRVLLGEVERVDTAANTIHLADGQSLAYDYLIVATGARHSYFGRDDWEPAAPGLKTLDDALEVRRRVLAAYEQAERTTDPDRQRSLLTFVVVGGGPTGVELAGALAEIGRHTLASEYRNVDPRTTRVLLVERAPRLLPTFPESLSTSTKHQLEHLGVEVRNNAAVTHVEPGVVTLSLTDPAPNPHGPRGSARGNASHVPAAAGPVPLTETIRSATILWAAGNTASPLGKQLNAETDRAGRVLLSPDLSVPTHPNVFVVGDLAAVPNTPGVAPAAMQMGTHAAKNILEKTKNQPTRPFRYWNKGNLATIGRNAAVADLGRLRFSGFPAWLAWGAIHIFYLIGFENRLLVLIQWLWAYLTHGRGARLMTRRQPSLNPPGRPA
jgi:NADH dehydrogenase